VLLAFLDFALLCRLQPDFMQCVLDLVDESDVDELGNSQGHPAVRALLARLSEPLLETSATRKLAAARAHHGLVKVSIANEALE